MRTPSPSASTSSTTSSLRVSPPGTYTKGALQKSMLRMAKEDPALYAQTIVKVNLGDTFATMEASGGADDIAPLYKKSATPS